MPRPMFRANMRTAQRQSRAEGDKAAICRLRVQSLQMQRPVMKVVTPKTERAEFIRPDDEWIKDAAYRAEQRKPRPQRLHKIKNFRRVSDAYALIQVGGVKNNRDRRNVRGVNNEFERPKSVENLIYKCLVKRVEAARIAIEDPGSELRRLEEKAVSKKWPRKVYMRRITALENVLANQHEKLDLKLLLDLMRQTQKHSLKERGLQEEIRRLWRKAKKRHGAGKFTKQNEQLQARLAASKDDMEKLKQLIWVEWLDLQAAKIFFDLEDDIIRIATHGRVKSDSVVNGRRAVFDRSLLWRPVRTVAIAEFTEDGELYKVIAISTPNDYNNKRRSQLAGKRASVYRNHHNAGKESYGRRQAANLRAVKR